MVNAMPGRPAPLTRGLGLSQRARFSTTRGLAVKTLPRRAGKIFPAAMRAVGRSPLLAQRSQIVLSTARRICSRALSSVDQNRPAKE
jgi:hypothetical protein